ncbi:hypothetical protein ASZ90_015974 [hydrocarbon metagenome]|uniref:Uncharacterized protein n=1 Tax=hydrocarbon metagenome TaxID=938273 RepID=A0A0W8F0N5_9ZZZZ
MPGSDEPMPGYERVDQPPCLVHIPGREPAGRLSPFDTPFTPALSPVALHRIR